MIKLEKTTLVNCIFYLTQMTTEWKNLCFFPYQLRFQFIHNTAIVTGALISVITHIRRSNCLCPSPLPSILRGT